MHCRILPASGPAMSKKSRAPEINWQAELLKQEAEQEAWIASQAQAQSASSSAPSTGTGSGAAASSAAAAAAPCEAAAASSERPPLQRRKRKTEHAVGVDDADAVREDGSGSSAVGRRDHRDGLEDDAAVAAAPLSPLPKRRRRRSSKSAASTHDEVHDEENVEARSSKSAASTREVHDEENVEAPAKPTSKGTFNKAKAESDAGQPQSLSTPKLARPKTPHHCPRPAVAVTAKTSGRELIKPKSLRHIPLKMPPPAPVPKVIRAIGKQLLPPPRALRRPLPLQVPKKAATEEAPSREAPPPPEEVPKAGGESEPAEARDSL